MRKFFKVTGSLVLLALAMAALVTTPAVIPALAREQALWLGLMFGLIGVMVLRRRG